MKPTDKILRGRVIQIASQDLTLQNERGCFQVKIALPSPASLGDLVEIRNGSVHLLTKNHKSKKTFEWLSRTLDPRRVRAMTRRSQVEAAIREFFQTQGFLETRTPLLVPCPGMEPHIRPFIVKSTHGIETFGYLPTSPEFAMKRLLVGGLEKVFQICSAFRDEPESVTHLPEFTILEWYRAYAGYEEIMKDTENLFEWIAVKLFQQPKIHYQGKDISVKTPWPRLQVRDLFQNLVGVDLVQASTSAALGEECRRLGLSFAQEDTWDDLYFRIWLNRIEPLLPADQAVFVTRYPESQAALSVIDTDPDGSKWARRFEVYIGGLELGNAFEELTDPVEQRKRFVEDMELRTRIYGPNFPKNPLDEGFLDALTEGMPPSGGIAVGVDRMVMLYADESDIEFTTWLPFEAGFSGTQGS